MNLSDTDLAVSIGKIQQPRNIPICRYGSGCTHLLDPTHREKFRHPNVPILNDEKLQSQFICNECGYATKSIPDLQRKTAWSNKSLVGCRINCLVDYKEWYEGYVLQYHKSGKHFVEFRIVNEKRWLVMKKVYFYIIERPTTICSVIDGSSGNSSEFKESNTENEGLAPVEDCWVYEEDISIDFAFAQSVLFKIYGNILQETGHLTMGHICLTKNDKNNAISQKGSLLYGELLPRGVNKALGYERLNASKALRLFDLGMGTGKILIQAFLQFKNLTYVHGVELSEARYKIAEEALLKMVHLLGINSYQVHICPGQYIIVKEVIISNINTTTSSSETHRQSKTKTKKEDTSDENTTTTMKEKHIDIQQHQQQQYTQCSDEDNVVDTSHSSHSHEETDKDDNANNDVANDNYPDIQLDNDGYEEAEFIERVIHLKCGNMFDIDNIASADIVMMETDVPIEQYDNLKTLLVQIKESSGLLTYLDLRKVFDLKSKMLPFKQIEENKNQADRYPTSWSVQRGHHFYLWKSITKSANEIENEVIRNKSKINKDQTTSSNNNIASSNIEENVIMPSTNSSPLRIMLGTLSSNQSSPMINICSPDSDTYHIASSSSSFRSPLLSINLVGNHATIATSNSLVPNIESPILLLRNSFNIHDNMNSDSPYQSQYQYQQQLFSQNNQYNEQLSILQKQNQLTNENNMNLLDHVNHSDTSYSSSTKESNSNEIDYDSNQCLPCSFLSFLFPKKIKKTRNFEINDNILKKNTIIENNHYNSSKEIIKSTNIATDNIQENDRTTVIPLNTEHVPSLKTNLVINA